MYTPPTRRDKTVSFLYWAIRTQEIRFGRKMNEITKFSVLEEEMKFAILDEIWTKSGQLIAKKCRDVIEFNIFFWEKMSNSFTLSAPN